MRRRGRMCTWVFQPKAHILCTHFHLQGLCRKAQDPITAGGHHPPQGSSTPQCALHSHPRNPHPAEPGAGSGVSSRFPLKGCAPTIYQSSNSKCLLRVRLTRKTSSGNGFRGTGRLQQESIPVRVAYSPVTSQPCPHVTLA